MDVLCLVVILVEVLKNLIKVRKLFYLDWFILIAEDIDFIRPLKIKQSTHYTSKAWTTSYCTLPIVDCGDISSWNTSLLYSDVVNRDDYDRLGSTDNVIHVGRRRSRESHCLDKAFFRSLDKISTLQIIVTICGFNSSIQRYIAKKKLHKGYCL